MRKRINRAATASSNNYSASRKVHIAYLEENHRRNNALFMSILSAPIAPKSDLQSFEEGVRRQIELYKLIHQ
mgnify:FL=1|jgi:hypothetical protein|nr:MAG TPA: hypothetical protein [Bacteriophage sp.]